VGGANQGNQSSIARVNSVGSWFSGCVMTFSLRVGSSRVGAGQRPQAGNCTDLESKECHEL